MIVARIILNILRVFLEVYISYKIISTQFERRFDGKISRGVEGLLFLPVLEFSVQCYFFAWVDLTASIINWGYILILYLIFYKGMLRVKITCISMICLVCCWFDLWGMMITSIIEKGDLISLNRENSIISYIYTIIFTGCLFTLWQKWLKKNIALIIRMIQKYLWIILIFCIINQFFVVNNVMGLGFDVINWMYFCICTFSLFSVVCLLIFMFVGFMKFEDEEDLKLMGLNERNSLRQIEMFKSHYDELARKEYDFKHHMKFIRECLVNQKNDEALHYIEAVMGESARYQQLDYQINSGNIIVDMVLRDRLEAMMEKHIQTAVKVNLNNCCLEDTDLCTMLGNLLDNAYEAAVQCEEEKRWMHLDISSMKGMSMLTIENSCIAEPIVENGTMRSSKKEAVYHGFGMKNVKRIVDKYNGYMSYTYHDRVFTLKIQV